VGGVSRVAQGRLLPFAPVVCPLEAVVDVSQHECIAATRSAAKAAQHHTVSPLGGTVWEGCTCDRIKGIASDSQAEILSELAKASMQSWSGVLWCVADVMHAYSAALRQPLLADVCKCRKGILGGWNATCENGAIAMVAAMAERNAYVMCSYTCRRLCSGLS
jgi:hypothetical protein